VLVRKKRLLVDVDEVLCNFQTSALQLMQELFGDDESLYNRDGWDIFAHLSKEQRVLIHERIAAPGYCYNLAIMEGAREGIELLRQEYQVVACTRPYPSPTWVYERTNWLIDHFSFTDHTIINTAAKFMVRGDALIDDNPHNVTEWQSEHPQGIGILWSIPNTEKMKEYDSLRARSWEEVQTRLKSL
jgi:5'(3')-deoxyribonucleotidase